MLSRIVPARDRHGPGQPDAPHVLLPVRVAPDRGVGGLESLFMSDALACFLGAACAVRHRNKDDRDYFLDCLDTAGRGRHWLIHNISDLNFATLLPSEIKG